MKLYVGDYLGDTHHLGALEHGAYLLLLLSMWRAGGSLPSADASLSKLAKCSEPEWIIVKPVILPFFRLSRGKLTHKRLALEMSKYDDVSRKRSEAVRARVSKKLNENNAPELSIDTRLIAKPEPEPEPIEEEKKYTLTPREEALSDLRRRGEEVREAAGDALASMATHAGIASLSPLLTLLKAVPPCDWDEDVLPGITQAAAWHRSRDGPNSMRSWTTAVRCSIENRDRRIAGVAEPKLPLASSGGGRQSYSQQADASWQEAKRRILEDETTAGH